MKVSSAIFILGISSLFSSGCMSFPTDSSSLAQVVIESAPLETIQQMTQRVFIDDFYQLEFKTGNEMCFARNATTRDRLLWGHYGGDEIRMIVEVTFEEIHRDRVVVRADAIVRRGHNAPLKVSYPGRRPYQKLLNQVRANLVQSSKN